MKNMEIKKDALQDIVKTMKNMRMEKMKGYKKADDDEPSMEIEMHKMSKEKSKKLKDKLKQMLTGDDED